MKKERVTHKEIPFLKRYIRALCEGSGYPFQTGKSDEKISDMVFFLSGKTMTTKEGWRWAAQHHRDMVAKTEGQPLLERSVFSLINPSVSAILSPGFYSSREWREARYIALKATNGSCRVCGRNPRDHGVVLHVDHRKPRSKYPHLALDQTNLRVLCEDCNVGKSDREDDGI